MQKSMTIEELADYVNNQISKENDNHNLTDGRYSSSVSVRRIRDYLSKGLLDKPIKDGRNAYFDERHAQKLLGLRKMQTQAGLSEQYIKKVLDSNDTSAYSLSNASLSNSQDDESLQKNALAALSGMISSPSSLYNAPSTSLDYQKNVVNLVAQSSLGASSQSLLSKSQEIKKKICFYEPHPYVSLQVEDGKKFSDSEIKQITHDIELILRRQ